MPDLRPVFFVTGILLAALGALMLLPALIDFLLLRADVPEGQIKPLASWPTFIISAVFTSLTGGILAMAAYTPNTDLRARSAFILTTMSWVVLSVFSAIPFALGPIDIGMMDAMFESVSGITTTGSTVFTGLQDMPKGILLWRSMLQWIGGIGIIVTALAILPMLKVGGMQLFKLENSDMGEKILPKAAGIAAGISLIYLFLTLLCAICYRLTGMGGFDSVNHAMTTIATGGFSTHDGSVGNYMMHGADLVAIAFMLAGGMPFGAYLLLARGSWRPVVKDSQIWVFLGVCGICIALLTGFLWVSSELPKLAGLRLSAFNAISIITGTGYATTDYNAWGPFAVSMFFAMMFIGGCAGSTACSVKIFRYQVAFEGLKQYVFKMPRRNAVVMLRYNGAAMPDSVLFSVMGFLFLFYACFAVSAILLSLIGLDPITAWSAAGTSIANVGPGLGETIGPAGNFSSLPGSAKAVLMFNMLLGRLEIVTALVLLTPSFWRS